MKKIVFYLLATVSVIVFSQRTNAQINLEHTFEGVVNFSNGMCLYSWYASVYGDVDFYIGGIDENQIKLYNTDYSLYKSINLPTGYRAMTTNFLTKNLFNNDSKIEFLAWIENEENSKIIIINEDGVILYEVNGESKRFIVK